MIRLVGSGLGGVAGGLIKFGELGSCCLGSWGAAFGAEECIPDSTGVLKGVEVAGA